MDIPPKNRSLFYHKTIFTISYNYNIVGLDESKKNLGGVNRLICNLSNYNFDHSLV